MFVMRVCASNPRTDVCDVSLCIEPEADVCDVSLCIEPED